MDKNTIAHYTVCTSAVLVFRQKVTTVILEIFVVVNNSQLKETAKIKNSKIWFKRILTTANIYSLLKSRIIVYSKN